MKVIENDGDKIEMKITTVYLIKVISKFIFHGGLETG